VKASHTTNISFISILVIFLAIALGADWHTKSSVVDAVTFKVNILLPVLSIIAGLFLINQYNDKRISFSLSYSQLLIFIFFTYASLSFFWANDKFLFLEKWLIFFSGAFMFYVVSKINIKKCIPKISVAITLSGISIALIGILQYLFSFPSYDWLHYNNIPASTFGNKNAANQFLVLVFPLVLFLLLNSEKRFLLFIAGVTINAILFYMFYSVTKGAWIAVFVESLFILAYVIINKNLQKKLLRFETMAFVFIPFIFFLFLQSFTPKNISIDTFGGALTSVQERYNNSKSPRWVIWNHSIEYIKDSPFIGSGLGNFNDLTINQGIHQKLQRAHNDYLEILVELGFIGFSIFLICVALLLRDVYLINKNRMSDSVFFNFIFISLIGVAIHMFVSWPTQTIYGVITISFFYALITNYAKQNSHETINLDGYYFQKSYLFISCLIFLFGSFYANKQSNILSDFYYSSGIMGFDFNKDNLKKASKELTRSDLYLNSVAAEFYTAGYEKRALEIYSIASKKNTLAHYRMVVDEINNNKFEEAKRIIGVMKENSPKNPLTFLVQLELAKKQNNLQKAKEIYHEFKNATLDNVLYDHRAYLYLHRWSIILQEYQDTVFLYETLLDKESYNVEVENRMINYYVYQDELKNALPHLKFVLENKPEIIDPIILRLLVDKGFVKLKSNDNKTSQ